MLIITSIINVYGSTTCFFTSREGNFDLKFLLPLLTVISSSISCRALGWKELFSGGKKNRQDSQIIFSPFYQQKLFPHCSSFPTPFSKLRPPTAAWLQSIQQQGAVLGFMPASSGPLGSAYSVCSALYCFWQERRLSSRSSLYSKVFQGICWCSEARQPFYQ